MPSTSASPLQSSRRARRRGSSTVSLLLGHPLIRFLAVSLAYLPVAGCYTYTETSLESLSPGLQTRVRLDRDGFGRVVNQAAMNGVPVENMDMAGQRVIGRVVELDADNLTVVMRGTGGSVYSAAVPKQAIQEVALRRFHARRTLAAVGGTALLAAAVFRAANVGGSTGPPGGDVIDQTRLPLFSIRVP